MGSFWGHIDEGIFFILIAIWWTFHACKNFIQAESKGHEMHPRISYTVTCRRDVPVESIFKLLFPCIGKGQPSRSNSFCFLGEFLDGGISLVDENGSFRKLVYAQHMTIYGIFILHAIVDLLTWSGLPMMPGGSYLSAALSFLWYGVAFYYHASMHGKEPLETVVHVLPIYAMFVAAGAILLEMCWRSGVWTMLTRSYAVLTLGTWFSHVAFMLYEHDKFPGGGTSGWDRSDLRNVQYARACFGLHLLVNMLIMILCYLLTYFVLRMRGVARISMTYHDESDYVIKHQSKTLPSASEDSVESFLLQDSEY
ncbi:hypothetical protein BaRGS_00020499 [Batillaria attramentaria]|uniref:Uncharacterized protein n=1 Tax=Batillaria attramentaria TaxID=370345 RepID=A0ABD0KM16_9CAEN